MYRREGARESDLESCATATSPWAVLARATLICCPIKVPVGSLEETDIGICAVAVASREGVQNGLSATWRDPEDRAVAAGASVGCGSVIVAIAALDQSSLRI